MGNAITNRHLFTYETGNTTNDITILIVTVQKKISFSDREKRDGRQKLAIGWLEI